MRESERIGTVELLAVRIYPLDPNSEDQFRTEVVVRPDQYPVYRKGDTVYWMMTGRINGRGVDKIGDGLFLINPNDSASGPGVTFPSKTFGLEEFEEFLAEVTCTEGHPAQRLRFTLTQPIEARS